MLRKENPLSNFVSILYHLVELSLGLQSLTVLCQAGAGLWVLGHAVMLHHAVEESHEVLVLPGVPTHSADIGAGPVIRVTLTQAVQDGLALGVQVALRDLGQTVGHHAQDGLAAGAQDQGGHQHQQH